MDSVEQKANDAIALYVRLVNKQVDNELNEAREFYVILDRLLNQNNV